jgi:hypothetical protein
VSHQSPAVLLIWGRGLPLPACQRASHGCTEEPRKGSWTNWEPYHQTVKNKGLNNRPSFKR